jgi:hypothetical protein
VPPTNSTKGMAKELGLSARPVVSPSCRSTDTGLNPVSAAGSTPPLKLAFRRGTDASGARLTLSRDEKALVPARWPDVRL